MISVLATPLRGYCRLDCANTGGPCVSPCVLVGLFVAVLSSEGKGGRGGPLSLEDVRCGGREVVDGFEASCFGGSCGGL